jgi:signal transduction histidine kinase
MKPVDLAAVATAAVEATQPSAAAKGVRLSMSLEPHSSEIVADEDRLQQIIWNLLSNGVKFAPKGGEVTLHVARLDSRENHGPRQRPRHFRRLVTASFRSISAG